MMSRRWWLALVLMLAVALTGAQAYGSENPVNDPLDCTKSYNQTRCEAHRAGPDRQVVADWLANKQIQGLDPAHWAAWPIFRLAETGVLQVNAGDKIDPDAPATLFQAARIVLDSTGQGTAQMAPREIALRAAELGLMPGPVPEADRPLSRLDAAHIAAWLTDFPGKVEHRTEMAGVFTDWAGVPEASRDRVYWVSIHNRLFVGYPDRSFRPQESLTLGQFATVIVRLWAIQSTGPAPTLQGA